MATALASLALVAAAAAACYRLHRHLVRVLEAQIQERDRRCARLEEQLEAAHRRIQYLHAQGYRELPPAPEEPEPEAVGLPPLPPSVREALDAIEDPEARAELAELYHYEASIRPDADPHEILAEVMG